MLDRRLMAVLAAALLAACGGRDGAGAGGGKTDPPDRVSARLAPVGTLPQGVTSEAGDRGRELYDRTCVMCHGETGGGTQLGPSLVDAQWLAGRTGSYEEITRVVREGTTPADSAVYPVPMPPRGDGSLDDRAVQAVAAYTYSLAHPR